jgi:hypothetical protein
MPVKNKIRHQKKKEQCKRKIEGTRNSNKRRKKEEKIEVSKNDR